MSLDLDNEWSYLKTHGDAGWDSFPSYFDPLVPRVLDFLAERRLTITFFVVGQDAAIEANQPALRAIAEAGHEIGNHSFNHEPWLHLYERDQIRRELAQAEEAIHTATGQRPIGFRGPGFSCSQATLDVLAELGYEYDASTFPTFLGPLARAYYFLTTRLTPEQRRERKQLFGTMREGLRPLKPYAWQSGERELIEIPVTTMPVSRAPIHLSYILYLSQFSQAVALAYFASAVSLCRVTGVAPSLLLHPLDFLGSDDNTRLGFFPAMRVPAAAKIEIVDRALELLGKHYTIATMRDHAAAIAAHGNVARLPTSRFN